MSKFTGIYLTTNPLKINKFLASALRHNDFGLTFQPGGWTSYNDVLQTAADNDVNLKKAVVTEVIEADELCRFELDGTGNFIRANFGHTTDVGMLLEPHIPPTVLYSVVGVKAVDDIAVNGIVAEARAYVQLQGNRTAAEAKQETYESALYEVDCAAAFESGIQFTNPTDTVWLTTNIPPAFCKRVK